MPITAGSSKPCSRIEQQDGYSKNVKATLSHSDVEVSTRRWTRVRIGPASLVGTNLSGLALREPDAIAGCHYRGTRMTLTKQEVDEVVATYITAWVGQDPDLIVTIFTDSAAYHERVLEEPIRNREGIRAYWQAKVVESQAGIKCELLSLYLDGNTAIVEWEAEFDDLVQKVRKRMREIAVLVFEGRLIASLREYWASEPIANLDGHEPKLAPRTSSRP